MDRGVLETDSRLDMSDSMSTDSHLVGGSMMEKCVYGPRCTALEGYEKEIVDLQSRLVQAEEENTELWEGIDANEAHIILLREALRAAWSWIDSPANCGAKQCRDCRKPGMMPDVERTRKAVGELK